MQRAICPVLAPGLDSNAYAQITHSVIPTATVSARQPGLRVTAITPMCSTARTWLRVSGLIDGRAGYPLYGPIQGYAADGDLSFSCKTSTFRGIVSNLLRIVRANSYRD